MDGRKLYLFTDFLFEREVHVSVREGEIERILSRLHFPCRIRSGDRGIMI